MTHEPDLDELIGAETTGAERERLRQTHELLLQAGPPPELPPSLQKAPSFGVTPLRRRRVVKRRALVLLAAALSVIAVFFAGYSVRGGGSGATRGSQNIEATLALKGTSAAPNAHATLAVWRPRNNNWPMTLSVIGLPQLANRAYYEVYLVRTGRPWVLCGTFRGAGPSKGLTVALNAPYALRPGDSWYVTRPTASGHEPGQTVLQPVRT